MKKTGTKIFAIALVTLFLLCFFSTAALARGGIGVGPSTLNVDNATRGMEYKQFILVFNPGDAEAAYTLSTLGDAGLWISFWKQYASDTRIEKVTVPAAGESSVLVKIAVPQYAADGKHEATIVVNSAPLGKTSAGGTSVSLSADVNVTIMVTGGELVSAPPAKAGMLAGISLQGEPALNTQAIIMAEFTNAGQNATKAKFVGEAYLNGRMYNRVNSNEVLVPAGRTDMLKANLALQAAGNFVIKGYVDYEGKKTEVKELSFTVPGPSGNTETGKTETGISGASNSFSLPIIIGVAVVGALLIAFIAIVSLKRKKSKA